MCVCSVAVLFFFRVMYCVWLRDVTSLSVPQFVSIQQSVVEIVNSRATAGWTPLHWAAYCRRHAVVQLLMEAGADQHVAVRLRNECVGCRV